MAFYFACFCDFQVHVTLAAKMEEFVQVWGHVYVQMGSWENLVIKVCELVCPRWIEGLIDGLVGELIDGWMNEWMAVRMDGWIHGLIGEFCWMYE